MTCPVSSVGFWSGLLPRFLEEGTHYLILTECSAQPHCGSDPEAFKYIFFQKQLFSAPCGLDRLFSYQFTETPLKKTVVSLPQGLLSGKGKLISCWAEKIPGPGRTTTGSKAASSLIRMVMLKSMNIKTHSRVFCCLENDIYWTSDCSLNCTPLGLYLPLLNQFLGELMYFIAFHGRFVLYKLNYLLITLKT